MLAQRPKYLKQLKFPRHVPLNDTSSVHVFGDASQVGIGVTAYLRTKVGTEWTANLLFAKSKFLPKNRKWTMPQAELEAAKLAVQVAQMMESALRRKLEVTIYSDSSI